MVRVEREDGSNPEAQPVDPSGETAMQILDSNRIMAISTLRSDGWPQTTFVGYANEGFTIYFVIFRASQKFANIQADDRVSVAVGQEPPDMRLAKALYAAAFASELMDPDGRGHAWRVLARKHPNLLGRSLPDPATTAIMRAECRHVSVLDYGKGLGHIDALTVTAGEVEE